MHVSSTVNYWLSGEVALGWSGRFEQQNQPVCNKLNWLMVKLMFYTGRQHSKSQTSYVFFGRRDRKRALQLFSLASAKLHCWHSNVTTFNVTVTWWPNATSYLKHKRTQKGNIISWGAVLLFISTLKRILNFEERQSAKNYLNKEMC